MKPTLIYLIGEPGSGKTTLFSTLTRDFDRIPFDDQPRREALFKKSGDPWGVELGIRKGAFSGTDALGMSVIEKAIPWLDRHEFDLVLAEGARLANKRFLSAAVAAGYSTHLFLLDHPRIEEWRGLRAKKLGKAQNPGWVKGARTRAHNLFAEPPKGVTAFKGNPSEVMKRIVKVVSDD